MSLSRRRLFGLLGSVAAAPLLPRIPTKKAKFVSFEWTGHDGPYMSDFAMDNTFLEGMSQRLALDLFYGTDEVPRVYTGFSTTRGGWEELADG